MAAVSFTTKLYFFRTKQRASPLLSFHVNEAGERNHYSRDRRKEERETPRNRAIETVWSKF